jgi:hypothetical protein
MRRVFFVERKNPSSEPEYTEEVNLKLNRRLETVSTQAKPTIWLTPRYATLSTSSLTACVGFKSLISD